MKKSKGFLFLGIVFFITLIFNSQVKAMDIKNTEVDKNKVWKITFNNKIRYDEGLVKDIKILDKNGQKENVRLELLKDEKTILVKPPIRGYVEGEKYKVVIGTNVYSKSGYSKLLYGKTVDFTIKNEDPFENMVHIKLNDTIESKEGKQYIFNKVDNIIEQDTTIEKDNTIEKDKVENIIKQDKENIQNGWKFSALKYNKTGKVEAMIYNGQGAKEINVPIKLKGWLGVCVGYLSDTEEFKIVHKDKRFLFKNYDDNKNDKYINEAFFLADDFNEDTISIMPVEGKTAKIAYIKFVSLTKEQIEAYKNNSYEKTSKVVYDNDGFTDFFWGRYKDVESLENMPVNLRSKLNSQELNWTLGTTGCLNYNSEYAGKAFEGFEKYEDEVRNGDKLARKQILNILDSGKSPLEILSNRSNFLSVKVNASLRMDAFYGKGYAEFLNGSMYENYKDCLQNGSVKLSYYYPKFRNYILNLLKEAADTKNVDGITLDFCRYPNVMGTEATKEEKIEIMNYFMTKVRQEIPNKKITVRFPYLNTLSYGLDVETWIKEGLVDRIVPSVISYEEFYDVKKYIDMVKETDIEVYIGISANVDGKDPTPGNEHLDQNGKLPGNKYLTVEEYLFRAQEAYKNGSNGVFIFNALNEIDLTKDISPKYKLIGDKNKVDKWYKLEYPSYLVNYKVDWTM